ncbi:hypothetical protein [Niabella aurantiaca]|uniref:hypothetical protein n=1 Tax=Niabella aurantiaca TaxID=379900 RepID=UPI0003780356|nr:hypothetical protein [Niabella aurantiaca]
MARPRKQAQFDPGIEGSIVDPVIPDSDSVVDGEGITTGLIPADSSVIIEAPDPSQSKSYVIAAQFVDKDNFSKAYNVGDDIPASFDKQRIADLLKLGLIKEK